MIMWLRALPPAGCLSVPLPGTGRIPYQFERLCLNAS
jgi:hypothetical protein